MNLLAATIEVGENLHDEGGHLRYSPPKTKATKRTVPIPRVVTDEIEPLARGREGDGPLFTAPHGGPIRINQFRQRFWNPAVRAAGLDGLTMHGLRHTAVSTWIDNGATATEVAARAEHRSVATVYDRYGHLLAHQEQRLNDNLDAAYAAALDESAESGQVIDLGR